MIVDRRNLPPPPEPHTTGCSAGCGARADTELLLDNKVSDWDHLPITNRWRCGDCRRALAAVGSVEGIPSAPVIDTLPPDSIGALKKLPEMPPLKEGVR